MRCQRVSKSFNGFDGNVRSVWKCRPAPTLSLCGQNANEVDIITLRAASEKSASGPCSNPPSNHPNYWRQMVIPHSSELPPRDQATPTDSAHSPEPKCSSRGSSTRASARCLPGLPQPPRRSKPLGAVFVVANCDPEGSGGSDRQSVGFRMTRTLTGDSGPSTCQRCGGVVRLLPTPPKRQELAAIVRSIKAVAS